MTTTDSEGQLAGDFDTADDLLWQARSGRLSALGPLRIRRSGRIGPIVEMALARRAARDAYAQTQFDAPFASWVEEALDRGSVRGSCFGDAAGVFPLRIHDPASSNHEQWDLWATHAENAAVKAGVPKQLAAGLLGALGELQDNVYEHSGQPDTGIVAYAATRGGFEFVVGDSGIGVLASLHQNPDLAHVQDAGAALRAAASDGTSGLGSASGRGYGIGQLFRALAGHQGELRFRSDDAALSLWGDNPSLTGQVEVGQKAFLAGLTISVFCRAPNHSNGAS